MKRKHGARRAVANLPILRSHYAQKRLIQVQQDEITGLHESVKRLETINAAWKKEIEDLKGVGQIMRIIWPVAKSDLFKAAFKRPLERNISKKPPYVINWVIPPMGEASGGHTTILRIVQYLEKQGHTCRLYIYDPMRTLNLEQAKELLKKYPAVQAEIFYNEVNMLPSDALFATSWHTAYPVANSRGSARKFYFVQDFEPFFDPVGSYSTLSENTYRFGLQGITIGSWLSEKLSQEYGMACDNFEFGVDRNEYQLTSTGKRKKILFYARPVTPRRGFELGTLALEKFHKKNPDFEIHMIGWDLSRYEIPFPYVNHGILTTKELNALYNECAAALVLSFTNMSLLPLELMASGCIPVVNDAEHTRKVGFADNIFYANPTPKDLADKLAEAADSNTKQKATQLSEYTERFAWNNSYDSFERILINHLEA